MYLVESKGGAIACMLLALLSLGTWPAVLTLLERRGRLPQHTYLDYSITNLLAAIIIAFTFGQIGSTKPDSPNFITQLAQVYLNHFWRYMQRESYNLLLRNHLFCRIIGRLLCLQWRAVSCLASGIYQLNMHGL